MQARVDAVGPGRSRMQRSPDPDEPHVVVAPAERAGSMPGGERRGFIQEEQLGEPAGLEERGTMPSLEPQPAPDPSLPRVAAADVTVVVVEAPTVAVQQPASRIRDQLAEGRDPVLERHRGRPSDPLARATA